MGEGGGGGVKPNDRPPPPPQRGEGEEACGDTNERRRTAMTITCAALLLAVAQPHLEPRNDQSLLCTLRPGPSPVGPVVRFLAFAPDGKSFYEAGSNTPA